MVHFHRGDLLRAVGRVTVKADVVPDRERALGHPHDGHARALEVMHDGPDQLFRHRSSSQPSPTTIWRRIRTRYVPATRGSGPGAGSALVVVLINRWCFSPSSIAASSRSPSFAYTAATALPEPQSRTQYGWVPASRSYSARSGGCFPNTGISKSLPPSRPMLPHPTKASASSSRGPRGAGSGCISSHQPYASGVATATGGSARATSAGAAGGAGIRNRRSPRPHASAVGAPLAKNATSAPSRVAKWSSSWRGTALPASAFTACSAAAASLDPPPRPERTGIRLVSSSATPNLCPIASRTARAARTARFCSGGPRSLGPCTVSSTPLVVRENAQQEVGLGVRGDPGSVHRSVFRFRCRRAA